MLWLLEQAEAAFFVQLALEKGTASSVKVAVFRGFIAIHLKQFCLKSTYLMSSLLKGQHHKALSGMKSI